ncbi:hypothetical protein IEQ34_007430 [Dendrobium chrysotoxum]|uniref:Uncharacterized protein n=1 Tax=Dendrobium chrysotoxum TaxID=161865 RepID=A0AAV7HAE3_DENCH|nr:hypothetical protein IEQ34_007430 [Dendrobium chrysotoxum]
MTKTSKSYNYFIFVRILTSKIISEVTKDRALLNFANHKGYTINIGKLILSALTYIMRGSTSMGLVHPSLKYALCVAGRVRGDQNEEHLFHIAALSRGKILNFKQSNIEEEDPSEPRSSRGAGSSSNKRSAGTPKSLSGQVADLSGKIEQPPLFKGVVEPQVAEDCLFRIENIFTSMKC